MRKLLLKVTSNVEHSFSLTKEECAAFYGEYHYHPEFELTLIVKGAGTRFVGDTIAPFTSGDLVLLGAELPHMWKSGSPNMSRLEDKSVSISIHFTKNFLGEGFFKIPEMVHINALLNKAVRGIKFYGKIRKEVTRTLIKMQQQSTTERLISLLNILNRISVSEEVELLTTPRFTGTYLPDDSIRIKNVYQYVVTNFKGEIQLKHAASAANMSPTSFCRYFRQRTRKTFSAFVNEIRVSYACRLLQEEHKKIAEVCYDSGFTNLSNFNKQFKAVVHLTPLQYVKKGVGKAF